MRNPTRVDVSHFVGGGGRSERRRFRVRLGVEMPLARADEADVDLFLLGSPGEIQVKGVATADIGLNCSRCMEEWQDRRTVDFDRVVRKQPDPDGYHLPDDGWLLLDGIVIDEVVLSLPTAPLCEVDCRGICSGCGVHLNQGACECVDEAPQSPFAVLSRLL